MKIKENNKKFKIDIDNVVKNALYISDNDPDGKNAQTIKDELIHLSKR